MKALPPVLITPAEATALSLTAGGTESIYRAKDIYDAFLPVAHEQGYTDSFAFMCALATIYDAGRIQGIRECRNRKK